MLEELGARRRGIRKRQKQICGECRGVPPGSPPHWLSSAHGHLFSELFWEPPQGSRGTRGEGRNPCPTAFRNDCVGYRRDSSEGPAQLPVGRRHILVATAPPVYSQVPHSPQVLIPRQALNKLLHANLHLRVWILRKLHLRRSLRMRTFVMDGEGSPGRKNAEASGWRSTPQSQASFPPGWEKKVAISIIPEN